MSEQLARQGNGGTADAARHGVASRLAWILLCLVVALMASSLVIAFTDGETWDSKLAVIPVELALAVVGAVVAARTGHRLGWLFLAAGATGAVAVLAGAYAGRAPSAELPAAPWVGWIFPVAIGLGQPLLFLIPLLFPNGRPPSRRWWPVGWLAIAAGLVNAVCAALSDVDFTTNFPRLRDPVTVVAPLTAPYNLSQVVSIPVFCSARLP